MVTGRRAKRTLALLLAPLLGVSFAQLRLSSDLVEVQTLEAGESYQRSVSVQNMGNQPATLRVYQTDYRYLADGTTEYGKAGRLERSNAAWLTLPASPATVPAAGTLPLDYRVRVPSDASLTGSYYSVIMLEQVTLEPPTETPPEGSHDGATLGLRTVVRYAVLVVTNIGSSGVQNLELMNPSLQAAEAERGVLLQLDVSNPGERYLEPQVYLELYDQSGAQLGRYGDRQRRLLPGTSVRQDFDLGQLAPGAYTAVVIADAGGEAIFGARYRLEVGVGDTGVGDPP